jgi:hypothetical protein
VFDVKRLIGRKFSDASVQADKKLFPFHIKEGKEGKPTIVVRRGEKDEKTLSAEEVSGMVRAPHVPPDAARVRESDSANAPPPPHPVAPPRAGVAHGSPHSFPFS